MSNIMISFVEAVAESLKENHGYSQKYVQIQVGILAKNGIKSWYDLYTLTEEKLDSVKGLGKNTRHDIFMMRSHGIRRMIGTAAKQLMYLCSEAIKHSDCIGQYFQRYFDECLEEVKKAEEEYYAERSKE